METELVKIKYAINPNKLQSELEVFNKIQIIDENSNEIKQETLAVYAGEFELVRKLKFGDQIRSTLFRFRKITDYEDYINSIDEGYDAKVAIFNGYTYKKDTPQLSLINRSHYGNGCDFKHGIIEYWGNNCFKPTKWYSFVKCIIFSTGEDYEEQYLDLSEMKKDNQKLCLKLEFIRFVEHIIIL